MNKIYNIVKMNLRCLMLAASGIAYWSLFTGTIEAQTPSWAKKAAQAVFTLKTFGTDGQLLSSSNGFFTGENGEAVSNFTPFRNAARAVVIDAQGKEWPVEYIIGADDTYDVVKFQVATRKPAFLPLATTQTESGATIWLLPYSAKKEPSCKRGSVSQVQQFNTTYSYYTLQLTTDEQQVSSPVMNERGEAIGLLQPATNGQDGQCYAVGAAFANDLKTNGLGINNSTLRSTQIAKAVPEPLDQAMVALFMGATVMREDEYADFIDRFISKYPKAADGYFYRARLSSAAGDFSKADADMQQAIKVAEQKDNAHYQYAQLILQKDVYQSDKPYAPWTLDKALEESRSAWQTNPQPIYKQLQAQILFAQQHYDEACSLYLELTHSDLSAADMYYAAAQCKLEAGDKRTALALTDSACNQFTRPYTKRATPYLLARAQLSMDIRRYQQAINDMNDVVALEPTNGELWGQKASYELRVKLLDEALASAQECIRLTPQSSDGYLIAGIVQCQQGNKQQGLANLERAKSMGNTQAQTFIDKYKE